MVLPIGGFYGITSVQFSLVVVDTVGQATFLETIADSTSESVGEAAPVNGVEDPAARIRLYKYLVGQGAGAPAECLLLADPTV